MAQGKETQEGFIDSCVPQSPDHAHSKGRNLVWPQRCLMYIPCTPHTFCVQWVEETEGLPSEGIPEGDMEQVPWTQKKSAEEEHGF